MKTQKQNNQNFQEVKVEKTENQAKVNVQPKEESIS